MPTLAHPLPGRPGRVEASGRRAGGCDHRALYRVFPEDALSTVNQDIQNVRGWTRRTENSEEELMLKSRVWKGRQPTLPCRHWASESHHAFRACGGRRGPPLRLGSVWLWNRKACPLTTSTPEANTRKGTGQSPPALPRPCPGPCPLRPSVRRQAHETGAKNKALNPSRVSITS